MFDFRIIEMSNGDQIIDMGLKTPYESLTPVQMVEYSEVYDSLSVMEMLARKAKREAEEQRKKSRSLLYKAACLFGLV